MFEVFVGLGSNVGNRKKNIEIAISKLKLRSQVISVSSLYETEPVGKKDQPYFLNVVAEIRTSELPHELLFFFKCIERSMGRDLNETKRWGPRVIDIDILFYGDLILETKDLSIPHPLIEKRRFVLEPMCELSPTYVHPQSGVSLKAFFYTIKDTQWVKKVGKLSI